MKRKRLSLEILCYCLKGNSLLPPQYIVVLDSDVYGGKSVLLGSQADLNLNYLSFGSCVILGELQLLNLISSSVKWAHNSHFTELLFILPEPYKVVDAR